MDAFVLQEQSWIVIETTWSHKLNMLRICLTHFIFLGQSLRNSFFQIFQLGTCAPLCTWEQKVQCPLPNLYSLLRIVLQLWEVSPASRVQSRKSPIISSMLPHGISLGKMALWWSLVPWCPDALACTDATHPGMGSLYAVDMDVSQLMMRLQDNKPTICWRYLSPACTYWQQK